MLAIRKESVEMKEKEESPTIKLSDSNNSSD